MKAKGHLTKAVCDMWRRQSALTDLYLTAYMWSWCLPSIPSFPVSAWEGMHGAAQQLLLVQKPGSWSSPTAYVSTLAKIVSGPIASSMCCPRTITPLVPHSVHCAKYSRQISSAPHESVSCHCRGLGICILLSAFQVLMLPPASISQVYSWLVCLQA